MDEWVNKTSNSDSERMLLASHFLQTVNTSFVYHDNNVSPSSNFNPKHYLPQTFVVCVPKPNQTLISFIDSFIFAAVI